MLFGFALGLVLSALTRRTVLSMALTLGVYAVVRFALIPWRPHYLPAVREATPFGSGDGRPTQPDDLWIVGSFVDYQPVTRVPALQFIEVGIFAVLWRVMRRA